MLEAKQPASILERIQNVYQEYPLRFWVLMTGTFIDRLGTNLIMPFLAIYVLQRFDTKITQVGLICTLFAIGSGLGNFLAGALADRFGRRFTLILGLVCAATARIAHGLANTFFVALIVFSKLPETQPDKGSGSSGENFAQTLAGYKRTLQDGIFVAFVLISILTVTVYMQMSTTLSVYLVKFQHVSESFFGTLVMLNALMVVFLQFSISRWASRQPLLIIMIAGTAFYLVGFGSYGLPPSIPLFIFAMILITLGRCWSSQPARPSLLCWRTPDMRARYVATEHLNWITAQSLGLGWMQYRLRDQHCQLLRAASSCARAIK